jgi:hypothetical protein
LQLGDNNLLLIKRKQGDVGRLLINHKAPMVHYLHPSHRATLFQSNHPSFLKSVVSKESHQSCNLFTLPVKVVFWQTHPKLQKSFLDDLQASLCLLVAIAWGMQLPLLIQRGRP